jgi:hypothetical protein
MMYGRDGVCCGEDESEVRSGKRQGIVFSHFTFFAFFFLICVAWPSEDSGA